MSQRISFYVDKYIEGDPTIRVGLQRGLISTRILTRHIIEEERDFLGNFDDVRNAIRKYNDNKVQLSEFKDVYSAFKDSYINVKGSLTYIEIKRNSNLSEILKIMNELLGKNEKYVRILNNAKSFTLILSEQDMEKVTNLIPKEDIIAIEKEICAISMHLDPSVKHTPGIYFLIMGQISLNQINIYDIASYESQLTIYVDHKDGSKVHQLLYGLCEYQKKFCKLQT